MKRFETELTAAFCKSCDSSEHLSESAGGYWCGWCAADAKITLRPVRVITRETADRYTVAGTLIDLDDPPLQPLRITDGWTVIYNGGLYEVDPTPQIVESRWWIFKSDMLVLFHQSRDRLLDVCWTPEAEFENGAYRLRLYEGSHHGGVLWSYDGRDRAALVEEIETVLLRVTNGAL